MRYDVLLKRYFADDVRYADLINAFGFGGKQVVRPSDLFESDSQTEQCARDLIRKVAFGISFAVIGLENQDEVHYLMPLRVMSYDSAEYQRQAAKIRRKVRGQKGITGAEYLSGFKKDSRLQPCITFVLYYGNEWDGSRV